MGVGYVRHRGPRQQEPDGRGVRSVERNHIRGYLSDEPSKASLPGGVADRLSQRSCGNCDAPALLSSTGEERDRPPIVTVKRDQSAGIESDADHAAFRCLGLFFRSRTESAQARSLLVRGPPVCWSA